jgi:alpha-methylacyl-CoA racemase
MPGPLAGIRVVEMAGLGPGPFAAMMLADMGADVVRVDRAAPRTGDVYHAQRDQADPRRYVMHRGRRSIGVDLTQSEGVDVVLRLLDRADVLIEGFRPGVMERRGLGPDVVTARNPRLVYTRITGWGQDGPLATTAGHDIDYIAVAGALANFARPGERPVAPLAMVGDMGGGGMLAAFGIVCALCEAGRSGQGQVIDAAMVDGVAALGAMWQGMLAQGRWSETRGTNFTDPGAPHYDVYETSDHRYVAVGALEDPFWHALLEVLEIPVDDLPPRTDVDTWPAVQAELAAAFARRTRDEWAERFADRDACVAPVLGFGEAAHHPHLAARGTYVTDEAGVVQARPAPRFSRTGPELSFPPPAPGEHTDEVLAQAGFDAMEIARLRGAGTIA